MATGPLDHDEIAALKAELQALLRRCADAEQRAEVAERRTAELGDEVTALRAQLDAAAAAPMSFFDGDDGSDPGLARDGSDPRVLPLVLAATAVVAAMVTLLALVNGNLMSGFGLVMAAITLALAWAAARTRVPSTQVTITNGVVYAEQRGTSYRFDLRNDSTRVEMVGGPGDSYWQVKFLRRHMEPFVVDSDMVDPGVFVRQLREYRPAL